MALVTYSDQQQVRRKMRLVKSNLTICQSLKSPFLWIMTEATPDLPFMRHIRHGLNPSDEESLPLCGAEGPEYGIQPKS